MSIKTESTNEIIRKEFTETINKDSLKTHISIDLDDKNIMNEEGHSLVGNFINMLHGEMGFKADNNLMQLIPLSMASTTASNFTSVSNSGGKVLIIMSGSVVNYGMDHFIIRTITSTNRALAPFLNQILQGTRVSSTQILTQIDWDAAYTGSAGKVIITKPERYNAANGTKNIGLSLVVGTSNADTTIDSYYIYENQEAITNGTQSSGLVSTDNNLDVAYFPISRQFTNTSQSPVTINEIGLYAKVPGATTLGGDPPYILIARDKLSSPVVIPAGSTVYATYTMKTSITSGNGGVSNNHGFTYQLLQILCALHKPSTEIPIMLRSGSTTLSMNDYNSTMLRIAGFQNDFRFVWDKISDLATPGNKYSPLGIMIGTGTEQTVDITNFDIGVPIEHNANIQYHNTWIESIQTSQNSRSFIIRTLVRNTCYSPIIVGEIGLFVSAKSFSTTINVPAYPSLIYRNVMKESERFNIPSGNYCIVSLTISLVV